MMENNYVFIRKIHIKTQSQKKDVLVFFILLQETKNFNLFNKSSTQKNIKCHIQHEESRFRLILIQQVNYK